MSINRRVKLTTSIRIENTLGAGDWANSGFGCEPSRETTSPAEFAEIAEKNKRGPFLRVLCDLRGSTLFVAIIYSQ
jgi:hypothetical protein